MSYVFVGSRPPFLTLVQKASFTKWASEPLPCRVGLALFPVATKESAAMPNDASSLSANLSDCPKYLVWSLSRCCRSAQWRGEFERAAIAQVALVPRAGMGLRRPLFPMGWLSPGAAGWHDISASGTSARPAQRPGDPESLSSRSSGMVFASGYCGVVAWLGAGKSRQVATSLAKPAWGLTHSGMRNGISPASLPEPSVPTQ